MVKYKEAYHRRRSEIERLKQENWKLKQLVAIALHEKMKEGQ